MIVRDLFSQADPELVFYAYTLIEPVFSGLDKRSLEGKAKELKALKSHIEEYCTKISDSEIDYSCEPYTIFVLMTKEMTKGLSYDELTACHTVKDKDVEDAIGRDFTIWNDKGEVRIEHYGLDFISVEELAGYSIAEDSVVQQGVNVCCACILNELFCWGYTEETREAKRIDLEEKIDEAMKDFEEGRCYTNEEVMAKLKAKIWANATDDEKEYEKYRKEFGDKVSDIEGRYSQKLNEENNQMFIDAIKKEFGKWNMD